jgi:hypothetical protein
VPNDLLEQTDPVSIYMPGETNKYKTIEALAKAAYDKDSHISVIERENKELRDEYLKVRNENMSRAKLEDLIDQLQDRQLTSSEQPEAKEVIRQPQEPDIASIVDARISQREKERRAQENFNIVKGQLQERFGDNYQTILNEQMEELGLTPEMVNNLATNSPRAFFKTLGLEPKPVEQFHTPPRSQRISDNFKPRVQKRNYAYYQELKKANPLIYLDRTTAIQMEKDAQEQGDSFFEGAV